MESGEPAYRPAFPPHVEEAFAQGKLWRVKEILRGRIGSMRFDRELCEQYGWVLLRMADTLQAGKYLFLSGRRRPEYEQAISVYLDRHGRGTWKELLSSFPGSAKRVAFSHLPAEVRNQLRALGRPDSEPDEPPSPVTFPIAGRIGCWLGAILAGLLVLFLILSISVGAPILLQRLFS